MSLSKSQIPEPILMEVAGVLDIDVFERIAIQYLNIKSIEIKRCKKNNQNDCLLFMFDVLKLWAEKNPGENAQEVLHSRLSEAAEEKQLVAKDAIAFLVEDSAQDQEISEEETIENINLDEHKGNRNALAPEPSVYIRTSRYA